MKLIITEYKNTVILLGISEGNTEYIKASVQKTARLGDIYIARVQKCHKGMQAAFVDISPDQTCFMHNSEIFGIKELKQGDLIPVMVTTEALKTKEPVVSMKLTLTGQYMVLKACGSEVTISKKITLKKQRKALKEMFEGFAVKLNSAFGVTVRTNASNVSEEVLYEEYKKLSEQLLNIITNADKRTVYSVMYKERPWYIKEIIGFSENEIEEIITDIPAVYDELIKEQIPFMETSAIRLYTDGSISLNNLYSVSKRVDELTGKKVYLKCGGYLVIEQTEAFNVIDVNSGKCSINRNSEELIRKINTEAAVMAAKQIKLRNLSGIIIIDFINDNYEGETLVKHALLEEFKYDKAHPAFIDVTKLGLFEITRKKLSPSLRECFAVK